MMWKGPWRGHNSYAKDDVVTHDGNCYIAKEAVTSGGLPPSQKHRLDPTNPNVWTSKWDIMAKRGDMGMCWDGDWDESRQYLERSVVRYGIALYYTPNKPAIGVKPDSVGSGWEEMISFPTIRWREDWNQQTKDYVIGDVVKFGDVVKNEDVGYICIAVDSTLTPPAVPVGTKPTETKYWSKFSTKYGKTAEFWVSIAVTSTVSAATIANAVVTATGLVKSDFDDIFNFANEVTTKSRDIRNALGQRTATQANQIADNGINNYTQKKGQVGHINPQNLRTLARNHLTKMNMDIQTFSNDCNQLQTNREATSNGIQQQIQDLTQIRLQLNQILERLGFN